MSTETETRVEWAVDYAARVVPMYCERDARYAAAAHTSARVVTRTVTTTPWVPADGEA